MNVAAYVRVSTQAQSYATQVDAIERAAKARGDTIAVWYSEKKSGKKLWRPELERLLGWARQGCVRRIYVFKLDRITRSGVADTYKVIAQLRDAGVELVAVADNLFLKPGDGDVVSEVFVFALSLAAKLEHVAINERISAARQRLRAAGKPWGRPPRSVEVAKAARMRRQGRSLREIAVAMKVPKSTLQRALARKVQPAPSP